MSDDELIYLMAARQTYLTDEARFALATVVKARNISEVQAEIAATAKDLAGQARYEAEVQKKQKELKAAERKFVLALCTAFAIIGLGAAAASDTGTGLGISGAAVAAAALYEARRLLGRLLAAMFCMDT